MKEGDPLENAPKLQEYLMDNFTQQEINEMKQPKHIYEITFNKPGGLVMPIIVEFQYADGTSETIKYPVQVWRKNDSEVKKAIFSEKEIVKIIVDPKQETADVDTSNNTWPRENKASEFDSFKEGQ